MPASRRPGRCAPSGPRSPDTAGVLCHRLRPQADLKRSSARPPTPPFCAPTATPDSTAATRPVRSARLRASCRPGRCAPSVLRSAFSTYDRSLLPANVEHDLRVQMAYALAGEHGSGARYLSATARQFIIERDDGRCGLCHSPGCEIEQIEGDRSDPCDLRLLCHSCRAGSSTAPRHRSDTRTESADRCPVRSADRPASMPPPRPEAAT